MSIYFDNAATTPLKPSVLEAMMPFLTEGFGNPSSVYEIARNSRKAIEASRDKVAAAIGCASNEIFFTGSGTEADNWAIKGIAEAYAHKGNHIITLCIEHHAVLHTCKYLENKGFDVTYLPVKPDGILDLDVLRASITDKTILITIMYANNEIGVIQPVKEIGEIARERGILFHTDAVQAVGSLDVNVKEQNIDMLSLSAHKFGGPKGVGVLYAKKGIKLLPFIHGGGQEGRKRAGTENVSGIVGLGTAIEEAVSNLSQKTAHILGLREKLIDGVLTNIPNTQLNGNRQMRLPGNVNISFDFIEGESLLLMLDLKGIYASSGSACTSGSLDPSHVLLSLGLPHEKAHGSLRISLGERNTTQEVDTFLAELPPIVKRLRDMSPLC